MVLNALSFGGLAVVAALLTSLLSAAARLRASPRRAHAAAR
jgi:hypothetical protein